MNDSIVKHVAGYKLSRKSGKCTIYVRVFWVQR